jgi:pimeloyl-ACP methyl ester carboxylesterase
MKLRGDYSAKLSESSLPVLFFFGLQDNFISKEVSDKVMSAVPNAKYIFLEKSGHNGFLEEPHRCASIITEFSNGK